MQLAAINKRPFLIVLILGILLNISGIGIKFFTDDPGLYAVIARNIARTNNFADLIYRGHDWLDKPHFPFWMVAISFKLFGINTIAYKLPALLFFFISVIYTYKLARKFYDFETALIAILILLTAQHVIMSNTDVRAEPYIMGLLMSSVYYFYKVKERFNWGYILLASALTACAVMTKGIYLLIPIGFPIIGDYLFKKDIKGLLNFKWLLAFILTCLFTFPELCTLYTQFDLHPEKVVFGHTGISGIHWFLWDSQFGRFNNNSFIRNTHGSIFFFLHTLLWAFAPWVIIFYYTLIKNIGNLIKGVAQPEYLCICGAVPMLLIFSISKFQLPFYTNILFPFFAIITAVFIRRLADGVELKFFKITQYILVSVLLLAFIVINFLFAPGQLWIFIALFVLLVLLTVYLFKNRGAVFQPVFLLSCSAVICINAWFNLVIYPKLLTYRGDVMAAEYINQNYPDKALVSNVFSNALDFYINKPVIMASAKEILQKPINKGTLLLVDKNMISLLKQKQIQFQLIKVFDNYPHENLTLTFIIEKERSTTLEQYYLVKLQD